MKENSMSHVRSFLDLCEVEQASPGGLRPVVNLVEPSGGPKPKMGDVRGHLFLRNELPETDVGVAGKCIGGGSETAQMRRSGQLRKLLQQLGLL
jgi:hypothetical protein